MEREDVLRASRRENRNRDLVELEVMRQAGGHAGRIGALVCCVLSFLASALAHTLIYGPWVIYFSIVATQWTVRFVRLKQKSDLVLAALFWLLCALTLTGFCRRLLEGAV